MTITRDAIKAEILKPEEVKAEALKPAPSVELFGFSGDKNVAVLIPDQLRQSIRVDGKHGRILQSRPVQSWTAIDYLTSLLETEKVNYIVEPIYVQKRNSFPMLNEAEKNLGYNREGCPINRWMFDKIYTSINIPNIGNNLVNAKIGFGFSDDGIEMAFGSDVRICSNFSILGGKVLRTYRTHYGDAMSWESVEYALEKWVKSLEQNMKVEIELMQRMMNVPTNNDVVDYVIGRLYTKAIDQAYVSKLSAPFDTSGMSNFTQNVLKQPAGDINTVWDLYNYGTAVMKPGMVDIAQIATSSQLYADFLFDHFHISKN